MLLTYAIIYFGNLISCKIRIKLSVIYTTGENMDRATNRFLVIWNSMVANDVEQNSKRRALLTSANA